LAVGVMELVPTVKEEEVGTALADWGLEGAN